MKNTELVEDRLLAPSRFNQQDRPSLIDSWCRGNGGRWIFVLLFCGADLVFTCHHRGCAAQSGHSLRPCRSAPASTHRCPRSRPAAPRSPHPEAVKLFNLSPCFPELGESVELVRRFIDPGVIQKQDQVVFSIQQSENDSLLVHMLLCRTQLILSFKSEGPTPP